jgi:uncharacterized protein YjdB
MKTLRVLRFLVPGALVLATTMCRDHDPLAPPVPPVPVADVVVVPGLDTIAPGDTARLVATPRDAGGTALADRTVSWSTSDPAVATVAEGLVTGRATGSATITATVEQQAGASVIVVRAPVASVAVAPALDTIAPGDTARLVATPRDSRGNALADRTVSWSTSDSAIAMVAEGLVTGRATGSATITATSEGKIGASVITVAPRGGFGHAGTVRGGARTR